jgi:hypothetical protein
MTKRTSPSPADNPAGPDRPARVSSPPGSGERFWPYVDVPEEPTDEELAGLDPEVRAELVGPVGRPFSVTITFPRFDADDYEDAVRLARDADYLETGAGDQVTHRARFLLSDVARLRELWAIVGRLDAAEVLIDDRPVPYARQLWLPLCWFLLLK